MNIVQLEVSNWGPHRYKVIDMRAPIVGIIGANGKGKSFLLQAISYALTGALPLAKEKYIREYDPADPDRSGKGYAAEVKLYFMVNGEEGYIKRVIWDSGTSRELYWQGKTYKKQSDVDNIMEELLGADKAALQEAVFIKQGELTDLVKGTPATRQEIFRKLMNLNFLSARQEDVISKIRLLEAMNKDVSGELEQIKGIIVDKKKALAEATENSKNIQDLEEAKKLITSIEELSTQQQEKMLALSSLKNEEDIVSKVLASLHEGYQTDEAIDEKLKALKAESEELLHKLAVIEEMRTCATHISAYEDAIAHNKDIDARWDDITLADIQADTQRTQLKHTALHVAEQYSRVSLDVEEAKQKVDQYTSEEAAATKKHEDAQWDLHVAEDLESMLQYHIDIINGTRNDAVCMSCKRPIDATHIANIWKEKVSTEAMRSPVALLRELMAMKNTASRNVIRLQDAVKMADRDVSIYSALLMDARDSLNVNTAKKEDLAQQLEKLRLEVDKLTAVGSVDGKLADIGPKEPSERIVWLSEQSDKYWRDQAEKHSEAFMADLAKNYLEATKRLASLELANKDSEMKEHIQMKLEECNKTFFDLSEVKQKIKAQTERKETVAAKIRDKSGEIRDITKQIEGIETSLYTLLDILSIEHPDMATTRSNVAAQHSVAYRNSVQVTSIEVDLKELRAKADALEEDMRRNEKIVALQQEMRDLKALVARDGLPAIYMQEVFLRLTNRVQGLLNMMGANFQVSVDETQPCTFTFTRTDADRTYTMPQELLSGGQAVRLALALLLASQQIILPDVGLLVLDEPTSHVDQEGVESMRVLFQNLGQVLANSGMQIIVVDHNETLQTGFTEKHVLK